MKLNLILFSLFIFISNFLNELKCSTNKRLTYKEILGQDNTFFIINTEEEYKIIKNLVKNEKYHNSGSYTYEWSDHPNKTYLNLREFLPKADSEGHRDMTNYDYIYLYIYSKYNVNAKITMSIECQGRQPDTISDMKVCYKSYAIQINFKGWKEFRIPYKDLRDSYGADLSQVSSLKFYAKGYGCTPNNKTELFIDKLFFVKQKYEFNMKESEIEENFSIVLKRFINIFLGNNNLLNEKNQYILKLLKASEKKAIDTHNEMNKSGLPFNYSMQSARDMESIYSKIKYMARGYAIYRSEIYKNNEYLNDIINCLDFMHDNYYTKKGQNIFPLFDNPYQWEISTAQSLVEILVYLKDELSEELINKYLSPLNNYIPLPKYTMANRADVAYSCIIAGTLQKDYKRIAFSVEMLRELFINAEKGDGFYEDGSFIQHSVYAYNGGYGTALLSSLSRISYILDQTCFMVDYSMKENQYNWIINSFIPFFYDGVYLDLVRGRNVDKDVNPLTTGLSSMNSFCIITQYLENEQNIKFLKAYLKYIYQKEKYYYSISLLIKPLEILEEINSDESIITHNITNNFAKVYSCMDKALARINEVRIGISLSSTRIGKYESILENQKGWYQGDGMVFIYLSSKEYANKYWPYVNPYRLPGTTITNAPREAIAIYGDETLANQDFVGGTYVEANMVVAMKFSSEFPAHHFKSSLIGNKGYFFFFYMLICIGNNISCNDNYEVETIIENKKINGKFFFGDKEVKDKTGIVSNNIIYIENYGIIYIPDYTNVKYNITNNGFLEIYFVHGKNIKNLSYQYFILPEIDRFDYKKYVDNIEILSNTSKVTAIRNKLNNIIEYIFWESGNFNNIKVDNPCTIIMNEKEFYISDPSQKINYINVRFGKDNYMLRLNKGFTKKVKLYN